MTKKIHLFILFFIVVLITGLPLWLTSYQELSDNKMIRVSWILALVIAWIAGILSRKQDRKILFTVTGGFLGAYMIKIAVDIIANPTDHNLWPIELAYVTFIALCTAFAGIALAWITRKWFALS